MASTRYTQQPLQIYQDPVESFDHAPMPSIQNHSNSKKLSPLRPIKNAASRRNIVLNPPQSGPAKYSPLKAAHQSSSSPSRAPFGNKLNAVSMPPPGGPTFNTDSMEKKPLMSKFKQPQKALFTTFPSTKAMDKENYQETNSSQSSNYGEGFNEGNFSLQGLYGPKLPQKRMLMDAAPIHESRPFKKPKIEEPLEKDEIQGQLELPAPDSFPPLHDDGTKPPHSYAQLIGMSILRSPARRLTLAQIYKWISDTFSFYNISEQGWQNSIRHNLSLNKAFHKQERPKDDPGKGNYWAILPGLEHQFIKEKVTRKATGLNENVSILTTNDVTTSEAESSRTAYKPLVPAPQELPPPQLPTYTISEAQLPAIPELSSDATIPASDSFAPDEAGDMDELPPSSPLIRSSPPAMMHSSPPVARHTTRTQNTPPPVPRFPSSSRTRSHKRKFASMDDSGYFSSLDSSAMRPHQVGRLLTSEADRPRMKRGRAEEEIARLRGSSYDSPPKLRALSNFAPPSSSPLRRSQKYDSQMLPPLTPAMKLKAPIRPPPSVSPNTNLKLHRDRVRELVGSPERGITCLDEELPPWSPAFNLDDTAYLISAFDVDYDIFAANPSMLMAPSTGSPEKRSAKRQRVERSRSANILADITNSNNKKVTSTPKLSFTPSLAPSFYDSPVKGLGIMDSPSALLGIESLNKLESPSFSINAFELPQEEEFFGAEFLSEEMTDFSGMDIMQGFQKIGSGAHSSRNSPKANNSRPAFGRSFTTRF